MSRASQIRQVMIAAQRLDKDWMRKVPEDPAERRRYTPWMPFPVHAFLAMLFEALPETPGGDPSFLEIGCGPGSKLMLARDVAGLDVHGIERDDEMAAAARSLGLSAETADAGGWKGYGDYDLIWFNRPFRDAALQAQLEEQVWDDMTPGAVVMCANLEAPPPSSRFFPVLDDQEVRRGIYYKIS